MHLTEKNLIGQLSVLQWEHVVGLVDEVGRLGEELNPLHAAGHVQLALDRLAQAMQVAMATGALLCARGEWRGGAEQSDGKKERVRWRWRERPLASNPSCRFVSCILQRFGQ